MFKRPVLFMDIFTKYLGLKFLSQRDSLFPWFSGFHILLRDFTISYPMKLPFWPKNFQKIQDILIFETPY